MPAPTPTQLPELGSDVIASNVPALLVIASLFALAFMTVLLRSYARLFLTNSFGRDDWTMLFAMTCATACFASYACQISLAVGVIQPDQGANWQIFRARRLHMVAAVVGMSLTRISVAFFLMRLTARRLYTYALWGLVFLTCFTMACTCTLCIPIQAVWDTYLRTPLIGGGHAKCLSSRAFGLPLFSGIINVASDILLALFPISLIWTLRMSARSRVALAIALSLGVFASVTALNPLEPWIHDTYAIWSLIKLSTVIIAASLPATQPLLSRMYHPARSLTIDFKTSNSTSKSTTVCIAQPRPSDTEATGINPSTVPLSVQRGMTAEHDLPCASKQTSTSSDDKVLPRSHSPGKGEIWVTRHVEISTS